MKDLIWPLCGLWLTATCPTFGTVKGSRH